MNKNLIIGVVTFICLIMEFYCFIKQDIYSKKSGEESRINRKLYVNIMIMVCMAGMIIIFLLDKIL